MQAAAGHQVTVLVTNPGGQMSEEMLNGVQILRVPRLVTLASTPITLHFPLLLRRLRPDITHLHFPFPIGEISQYLFGRRPFVITYHSDVVRSSQQAILRLYNPLLRRILRAASRLLPTSENYQRSSPYLGPLAEHCTVISLGIDPGPFLSAAPLYPPADRLRLLFVGRHRYYKGVDDLMHAIQGLDVELIVAGSGPLTPAWRQLADELNIADRVYFIGDVPDADLPALYASADVFVLPANARAEAFGTVLLEAMAAGLPCITTDLGTGTSYVVQDGVTGLVVPPRQPDALTRAIISLQTGPALRAQLGQAGRARLLHQFTLEKMARRVEMVYAACW
jgi:rhamnosyl/mannosyltransferase